jgi:hypothetical protein
MGGLLQAGSWVHQFFQATAGCCRRAGIDAVIGSGCLSAFDLDQELRAS